MPAGRPAPAKPPQATSGTDGSLAMPAARDSRTSSELAESQLEGPVSVRASSLPLLSSRRKVVLDPPPSMPRKVTGEPSPCPAGWPASAPQVVFHLCQPGSRFSEIAFCLVQSVFGFVYGPLPAPVGIVGSSEELAIGSAEIGLQQRHLGFQLLNLLTNFVELTAPPFFVVASWSCGCDRACRRCGSRAFRRLRCGCLGRLLFRFWT